MLLLFVISCCCFFFLVSIVEINLGGSVTILIKGPSENPLYVQQIQLTTFRVEENPTCSMDKYASHNVFPPFVCLFTSLKMKTNA